MTDTSEADPLDAGGGATTATLARPGPAWEIPSSTGGAGAGVVPAAAPPAPAGSGRGATATIAAFVVMALAGFVVAGTLRSRSTPTPSTPPFVAAPARPSAGATPAPAAPSAGATANSALSSTDIATIAAKVNKGVVNINTELGLEGGRAAGTGMVLTSSGEVLTNNHVILGSTKITVTVVDTGRTYTAHVVGTAPSEDVAVLQLEGASGLKTVNTATATVALGDPVVATGNAGGRGGTPAVVAGAVVALGQAITATDENGGNPQRLTDLIQIDAPIEAGDSGGPLANRAGDVIGMNSAAEVSGSRFRATSTSGFAIPIAKAMSIVRQIESGKESSTIHIGLPAFLGVQMAASTGGRGTVPASPGALIAGVEKGTPAAAIGLAAGDTITSVAGRAVASSAQLTAALQSIDPGTQVAIGWTDSSGASRTARATLIAGPAD